MIDFNNRFDKGLGAGLLRERSSPVDIPGNVEQSDVG